MKKAVKTLVIDHIKRRACAAVCAVLLSSLFVTVPNARAQFEFIYTNYSIVITGHRSCGNPYRSSDICELYTFERN